MTKTELIKEGKRLLEISEKKQEQIMDFIAFRVYEMDENPSELMKKKTMYYIDNFWRKAKSTLMKESKIKLEIAIDEIKQTIPCHDLSLDELAEGLAYEQTAEPIREEKSKCTDLLCENELRNSDCKEKGCTDAIISNCRLAETCDKCFDGWMKMHPGLTCQDVYDLDNPDVGDGNKT